MHRPTCCLLLALLPLLAACRGESEPSRPAPADSAATIPFRRDGTLTFLRDDTPLLDIALEIAATDSARTRGMMQREAFPSNRSGMLFIFDRAEIQSFWMANTPVALDLLFIGADSQIVDIHKYARPFSPDQITSSAPARFVLEVPAGFVDANGIAETDRTRWQRD
jgi:uncharacterized membrane protein (UPF0127 family)